MALALVVTVGGATANSFATLAEANLIAEEVFPASEATAWLTGSSDDQIRALVRAAKTLNGLRWVGDLVDDTQGLVHPRSGLPKPYGTSYETTEIAPAVKRAQARLAFFLMTHLDDPDVFGPSDSAGLSSISFGSELSMSFEAGSTGQSEGHRFLAQVIREELGGLVYAPGARVVRG